MRVSRLVLAIRQCPMQRPTGRRLTDWCVWLVTMIMAPVLVPSVLRARIPVLELLVFPPVHPALLERRPYLVPWLFHRPTVSVPAATFSGWQAPPTLRTATTRLRMAPTAVVSGSVMLVTSTLAPTLAQHVLVAHGPR